ncbi:MAG TPA: hypothetical protein DCL21_00095 [Alphaproteobacteria bacterium]|nr:hypothetical protein [Alphaproteobacteria bacterium]
MLNKARKKLAGGGGGTVVLMIGLYLIILAFFILLNAISESSESNYSKASNSLKTSFGFTSGELEENEDKINITVEEFYAGISRKVEGVVSSYFPADEYDVSVRVGKMKISAPIERFFDGRDVTVNPMIYSFIFEMVKIIKNISNGAEIRMEVNVTPEKSFDNPDLDTKNLKRAVFRASDISNIIQSEGAALKSLSASANLADRNFVNIYIIIDIKDYQKAIMSYKDYIQGH